MRSTAFSLLLLLLASVSFCQSDSIAISLQETSRILNFLASDNLKGRGYGTPELQKAASFIANEFKKDSLGYFPGSNSYFHPFGFKKHLTEDDLKLDSAGNYDPKILLNVVGIIKGQSIPNEAILFSAHYDHIGITSYTKKGKDSINNGANDDASGVTALLQLAHYYSTHRNNARTLIFCAFSGEESGLLGSGRFVNEVNVNSIIANINIEMIGITNVSGKNAFFITGADYSDLSSILRKNLKKTKTRIVREPDLFKHLFMRSDNYSFAQFGVPAHTIMCSDDADECYHQPCDEVKRIDIVNMNNIIKAIVIGTTSLVNGTDTPRRIKEIN